MCTQAGPCLAWGHCVAVHRWSVCNAAQNLSYTRAPNKQKGEDENNRPVKITWVSVFYQTSVVLPSEMDWRESDGQLASVLAPTFALRGVLGAVAEDVDLVHGSKGLKQLLELGFWPRARNLAHKHLDGVGVRLVQVLHGPVHLVSVAVAEGHKNTKSLWLVFPNLDSSNDNPSSCSVWTPSTHWRRAEGNSS